MKFNRNLTIFAILLAVGCLMLVSQVSAVDFDGTSLSDLDNSIKTSDDGNIVLTDDLSFSEKGTVEINRPVTIDGNGHSINISSAQNDVLFDVKSDTTFKNLVLSGGNLGSSYDYVSIIRISSSSKLTLENVTIKNVDIGNTVPNSYIFNSGTLIIENSNFHDISCTNGHVLYNNLNSSVTYIDNSNYSESTCSFVAGSGEFNVYNSYFHDLDVFDSLFDSTNFGFGFNLQSSLFVNIKNKGYDSISEYVFNFAGQEVNDTRIENNVFLGCSKIFENIHEFMVVKDNYFGSNSPVVDGLIPTNQNFNEDDNIKLEFLLPENDDINNLTVGKKTPVEFKLIGNTQLLPKFSVNLTNLFLDAELSQNSITFGGDSAIVYITPREKGNGSIVLGYDLYNAIKPSFNYSAYGDLKNYSLVINTKDSITYGDDLDVILELKDSDSNPVSGSVSLFVNRQFFDNVNVVDGIGSIKVSKLNATSALLDAFYYHELSDYNDADVNKSIAVQKRDLDLKYGDVRITEGETATVTVSNIPDDLTSSIVISLSNEGGQVHPSNGVASQTFYNLAAGNYKVSIFTLGDNNYNLFDDVAMIYVAKSSSTPDSPVTPDNPGDDPSVNPGDNPGDSDNPVNPDVPIAPETPDSPDVPDSPGGSDNPVNPDVPTAPDTPSDPVNPDAPDVPDVPDVPDSPDVPDAPDVPDVPDSGDIDVVPSQSDQTPQDNANPSNSENKQNNKNNEQSSSAINSDSINSNSDNAQSVDTTTGTSNNAVVSSENSAPSTESQSQNPTSQSGQSDNPAGVAKSYDINEVIDNVIHSQFTIPSIVIIAVALFLLIFGYRRKQDGGEDY